MTKDCVAVIVSLVFLLLAGTVYAQDIPPELRALGYTQDLLVSYDKENDEEFFTFYDVASPDQTETITFIIQKGKIIQTIKGQTAKFQNR
jgi:hypothetical protein